MVYVPDLPKGSYTRTVSKHIFHRHLLATSMDQQHNVFNTVEGEQSLFTQFSSSSLSDIHKCSGGIQMAPSTLGKQTANCEAPHSWLISLSMNLACFV